MRVLKLSGHTLQTAEMLQSTARTIASMKGESVIVHGGGPMIDELQARLGQRVQKMRGLRVTDHDALNAALMMLCGQLNKRLVAALISAGIDAFGFSGIDAGVITVDKCDSGTTDLGFVGEVEAIRVNLIMNLLSQGITPVIAPPSLGLDGEIYNVNADEIAARISIALAADELLLISNVPGVLIDGHVLQELAGVEAQQLIERGEIAGGMIPKVQAGLRVLNAGVRRVCIADMEGLHAAAGTWIVADEV